MPILEDISVNSPRARPKTSRKSMLILSDSEGEEDYDTAVGIKPKHLRNKKKNQSICLSDDDDDDDDASEGYLSPLEYDKDKDNSHSNAADKESKRKHHPDSIQKAKTAAHNAKNPAAHKKTPNPKPKKRRRRSSARFLRLSGRFGDDNDGLDEAPEEEQREKLNEMYSQAIQLNAANKINAGNSWGLNIIDKMDKFLGDDEDGTDADSPIDVEEDAAGDKEEGAKEKRVNFTKASCTIDACVKIYSYRVDDAHLTSYKVLANLNRTDSGKPSNDNGINVDAGCGDDGEEGEESNQRSYSKRRESTAAVKTVETNMANLNISKLDSAYDIDPIFHKMSQKFDEGGAKGLLLVNLGVANDGCRIVLDSKEDSTAVNINAEEPGLVEDTDELEMPREEGIVDISCLVQILEKKSGSLNVETIQLVPQLDELRQTYALLEEEGFVEAGKTLKSKSIRYANNVEEDRAAEAEIHREALERSTASGLHHRSYMLPNQSMMTTNLSMMGPSNGSSQINSNDHGADDFDDGYNEYDDGDDGDFENFVAMDEHAEKYSSDSFRNDLTQDEFGATSNVEGSSAPPTFLDEICEGDALTKGGQFNYFNPELIDKLTSGNQWAGSAHWKKNQTVRLQKTSKQNIGEESTKKRKDSKRKTSKEAKKKSYIDLGISSCNECLEALLSKKKATRGKGTKRDTTQITKAAKQKHDKDRNILPLDAGINGKHFTEFFMRPGASIIRNTDGTPSNTAKTVGFLGINTEHFDDGVDDSYDDGPGFELADNDVGGDVGDGDYVVQELEGIRKVDKVRVNHATVAKKVDVRRLKKDLWDELEATTTPTPKPVGDDADANETIEAETPEEKEEQIVSFKKTVDKLGATEAQEDVSLPFYFICVLHLANEKGLKLENGEHGLNDFVISRDSEVALPTN